MTVWCVYSHNEPMIVIISEGNLQQLPLVLGVTRRRGEGGVVMISRHKDKFITRIWRDFKCEKV